MLIVDSSNKHFQDASFVPRAVLGQGLTAAHRQGPGPEADFLPTRSNDRLAEAFHGVTAPGGKETGRCDKQYCYGAWFHRGRSTQIADHCSATIRNLDGPQRIMLSEKG